MFKESGARKFTASLIVVSFDTALDFTGSVHLMCIVRMYKEAAQGLVCLSPRPLGKFKQY